MNHENTVCNLCNKEYSSQYKLKSHLWQVHNIGEGKIFYCTEEGCDYNCKTNGSLKRHLWQVHNIGNGKIFYCTEEGCDYNCKTNGDLKRHLWQVHNIGEGKIFYCTEEGCDYNCKTNGSLKRHLWQVHNIGNGKIFYCTEEGCDYNCKTNDSLKMHLSGKHDIGDFTCEICCKNVSKLSNYIDIQTKEEIKACRMCYHMRTGYETRVEKQMVEYIKKDNRIGPYIVLEDEILRGDMCNTRRRPDVLISSSKDLAIIVECDENQHRDRDVSCELGRMDEILDEFTNTKVIFIRWNPDYYKYNGVRGKIKREERLKKLSELIVNLKSRKDWDNYVMVYYMYYSEDNPVISNRHSHEFVW